MDAIGAGAVGGGGVSPRDPGLGIHVGARACYLRVAEVGELVALADADTRFMGAVCWIFAHLAGDGCGEFSR
jgi:hypothetical protein